MKAEIPELIVRRAMHVAEEKIVYELRHGLNKELNEAMAGKGKKRKAEKLFEGSILDTEQSMTAQLVRTAKEALIDTARDAKRAANIKQ